MKTIVYCLAFLSQLSILLAGAAIDFKCLIWDSSCLTANAQALSTFITTGIPQLGIEKLDPIIDSLHIDSDGLQFDMRNMHAKGMKNVVVDNVSIDAISKVVRILFHTDFRLIGDYTTSGFLFSLPIYGDGDLIIKLNDVHIDMVIPFDIVKDTFGRAIIDLKSYQYTFDVRGGAIYDFDNLYNGDKHSSDIMHQLLHQNWKLLVKQYGKFLFDKVNDKVFNSIRNYMYSNPLSTIVLY